MSTTMKEKPKVKKPRKYTITSGKKHPAWVAFDQYISLFLVPLALFIRAVVFLQTNNPASMEGLIAGIWILIAVVSTLISGVFLWMNNFWLNWRMNWWKNLIASGLLFLLSTFLLALFIRASG